MQLHAKAAGWPGSMWHRGSPLCPQTPRIVSQCIFMHSPPSRTGRQCSWSRAYACRVGERVCGIDPIMYALCLATSAGTMQVRGLWLMEKTARCLRSTPANSGLKLVVEVVDAAMQRPAQSKGANGSPRTDGLVSSHLSYRSRSYSCVQRLQVLLL